MHEKQWDFLKNKFEKGQLAHAYLLSGQEEADKVLFAKEFLKFINCLATRDLAKPDHMPCNECQNCKMIESKSFPDLMVVKSENSESSEKNEKDMMSIGIEQIREVQSFLSLKPYYDNNKAVIIENAERMTFEAQNCFLKTLEEPKSKTIIMLISSRPTLLLPTVLSRCQEIKFFYKGKYEISKNEEIILNNFEKIMNASLAEKFQYAKNTNLDAENFNRILGAFRKYFRQLLLSKIMQEKNQSDYPIEKIKKIIELIENASRQSDTVNINRKLALEIVLLEL